MACFLNFCFKNRWPTQRVKKYLNRLLDLLDANSESDDQSENEELVLEKLITRALMPFDARQTLKTSRRKYYEDGPTIDCLMGVLCLNDLIEFYRKSYRVGATTIIDFWTTGAENPHLIALQGKMSTRTIESFLLSEKSDELKN